MTRSPDPSRREEVLSAVASVMQTNGVFATRLQDIGERLGIAYTTLYHYFSDRDQLLEEVLLWTLDKRRNCLESASGGNALETMLDFAARDISSGWEHKVAMPFLGALPAKNRRRIVSSRSQLLDALVALVRRGIEEKSIRDCHPETISQVVLNCLERIVSFDDWLATAARSKSKRKVTDEVVGIFRRGILADGVAAPVASFNLPAGELLLGTPPGISRDFDHYQRIMRTATEAFNREGALASIPRMAKELGLSKSVIYHYVVDKRDLLNQCYLRGVCVIEVSHRIASLVAENPVDEILIHRDNLFSFHESSAGPFTSLNALGYLHPAQTRVLQVKNAAVRGLSEQRLERGIRAGMVRENIDPQIAQALFGQVLYGLPSWHDEKFALSAMDVANESGRLLLKGLQP